MVSLPLRRFLLSIDFNRYVGTGLGAEGTSDTTFRFFHVNNVIPALVMVGRIGEHILGAGSEAQAAALTPLSVNYYGSFCHLCALCGTMSTVCRGSTALGR